MSRPCLVCNSGRQRCSESHMCYECYQESEPTEVMTEPTTAEIREAATGDYAYQLVPWYVLLDRLEASELERNAAIQSAVVSEEQRVKAEDKATREKTRLADKIVKAEANRDDIVKNLERSYAREAKAEANDIVKNLERSYAREAKAEANRDELLVQVAEMKQAMSFDWDLFKSTQESLREHMTMLRKISELPEKWERPTSADENDYDKGQNYCANEPKAITGKPGE